jgi:hypothetical protein
MADLYGVLPADVASELPALFPRGFDPTTTPSDTKVAQLISTADAIAAFRIGESVGLGANPATDTNAVLARRYIIEWVKAQVTRIVYAGKDPVVINAAAAPSEAAAAQALDIVVAQVAGVWGSAIVVRGS